MKKLFMISGLFLMILASISCDNSAFTSPHTGEIVGSGSPSLQPTDTPTTPVPTVIVSNCFNFTPVSVQAPATLSAPSPLFTGVSVSTYVIRSMADWQAYCGSTNPPTPPVNFNSQMIIVYDETLPPGWCGGQIQYSTVCATSNQMTVSVTYENGQQGTIIMGAPSATVIQAVAVSTSPLAVQWSVINLPLSSPCPI